MMTKIFALIKQSLSLTVLILISACSKENAVIPTQQENTLPPLATSTVVATELPRAFIENLPAGDYIVYSSLDTSIDNPTTSHLNIASLDGQYHETIAELPYGAYYQVKIAPDGERVAFIQNMPPEPGIFLMELSTREITKIREVDDCRGLDWSPDGTKIVMACSDVDVYSLEKDKLESIVKNSPGEFKDFHETSWSPDGKWILAHTTYDNFADRDLGGEIYLITADCLSDTASCPEKTRFLNTSKSLFYSPTWSPDSRSFAAFLEPGIIGIWDIEAKDSRKIIIPDWENSFVVVEWGKLAWSPDGKWLAYSQPDIDQEDQHTDYDLFVVPVDGGKPRVVLNNNNIKLVMRWLTIP